MELFVMQMENKHSSIMIPTVVYKDSKWPYASLGAIGLMMHDKAFWQCVTLRSSSTPGAGLSLVTSFIMFTSILK